MGSISRIGPAVRPISPSFAASRRRLARLALWCLRAAQRRHLAELMLDPHLLRDLGLTRHEAACEIRKPFWRS